jgi:hypothetical protein
MPKGDRMPAFTRADDEKLMRLRARGIPPRAIAIRLGRSVGALYVRISKLKKAERGEGPRYSLEEWTLRRQRAVHLFENGATLIELSRMYDTTPQCVSHWLTSEGLDSEERKRIQAQIREIEAVNQGDRAWLNQMRKTGPRKRRALPPPRG